MSWLELKMRCFKLIGNGWSEGFERHKEKFVPRAEWNLFPPLHKACFLTLSAPTHGDSWHWGHLLVLPNSSHLRRVGGRGSLVVIVLWKATGSVIGSTFQPGLKKFICKDSRTTLFCDEKRGSSFFLHLDKTWHVRSSHFSMIHPNWKYKKVTLFQVHYWLSSEDNIYTTLIFF